MSITTVKNAQAELELAAINLAVLLAPYVTAMPTDLEDDSTGDLSIPSEFESMGNFTKADGQTIGKTETNTEIESHGESDPTRIITNKRTVTVAGRFQETKRGTLEAYWGEDFSAVTPSAHGGFVLPVSALPKNIHYRLLLVAEDDYNGDPIYPYWMAPRARVTTTGDIQLTDNGLITFPCTFTFFRDSVLDYSVRPGFCGEGWKQLSLDADTGFGTNLTNEIQQIAITGSPTGGTFTLTYSGQTTAPIVYNASAGVIEDALEGLSNIGTDDVLVGGSFPTWTVTFRGALGHTNVTQMTATGSFTGGTTPAIAITTTQAGGA